MLCTFVSIPFLLKLLGTDDYGVWVTLTSLIGWYLTFDLGISNAIRNRVAEASASVEATQEGLREILAGSIQIYLVIALGLAGLTLAGIALVEPLKSHPWESVVLYGTVLTLFPLSLSSAVFQGEGKFIRLSCLSLILPVGWMAFNLVALPFGSATLLVAATVYALLLLAQSMVIAREALQGRVPLALLLHISSAKSALAVVNVGLRFFALQISSLVLFYSGNFISFQNLDAAEVARFDTVNKVFMLFSIALNIVTSVTWTEAVKAKSLYDRKRMKSLFRQMLLYCGATAVFSFGAAIQIDELVKLVAHGWLSARYEEAWPFAALVTVQSFAYSGAVFLNAYERVNGQIILSLLAVPIFLTLSVLAFDAGHGIASVPLATTAAIMPSMFYCLIAGNRLVRTT